MHDICTRLLHEEVCIQLPMHADNMALPASANCMPLLQKSIDICCLLGPQQQTCSSGFAAVGPCWDRQMGRHTDTVLFHRPCCAQPTGTSSASKHRHHRCGCSANNLKHSFFKPHFTDLIMSGFTELN